MAVHARSFIQIVLLPDPGAGLVFAVFAALANGIHGN